MDWQEQSITVYLYVCKHYEKNLWVYCQRMSNHADLSFSDEEVIALYLFEIIQEEQEKTRAGDTLSLLIELFLVALAKQGH